MLFFFTVELNALLPIACIPDLINRASSLYLKDMVLLGMERKFMQSLVEMVESPSKDTPLNGKEYE